MLKINPAGIAIVKRFEGCRLIAYRDIAGVLSIGYGETDGITPSETMTQEQADNDLADALARFSASINNLVSDVPNTSNQFSAMVSLAYNIGVGAFRTSSVLRFHRIGQYAAAAASFLLFDKSHVDGALVEVDGLLDRRKAEAALYEMAAPE